MMLRLSALAAMLRLSALVAILLRRRRALAAMLWLWRALAAMLWRCLPSRRLCSFGGLLWRRCCGVGGLLWRRYCCGGGLLSLLWRRRCCNGDAAATAALLRDDFVQIRTNSGEFGMICCSGGRPRNRTLTGLGRPKLRRFRPIRGHFVQICGGLCQIHTSAGSNCWQLRP